jgi:hypothetical protein
MLLVRNGALSLLACALLSTVGCGAPRVHRPHGACDPVLTITVFNDGFHSGIILPYAGMPIDLDRQRGQVPVPLPFVEIGFGESQWVQNLDRSFLHMVRLGMWPSQGMLLLINHPQPRRDDRGEVPATYHEIQLTGGGRDALYAEIAHWLDRAHVYVRPPTDPLFLYRSTRAYTPFRNCHDFTICLLRAARFPIKRGWLNTSSRLERGVVDGIRRMREAQVAAAGP